jgi:hypothetical protein
VEIRLQQTSYNVKTKAYLKADRAGPVPVRRGIAPIAQWYTMETTQADWAAHTTDKQIVNDADDILADLSSSEDETLICDWKDERRCESQGVLSVAQDGASCPLGKEADEEEKDESQPASGILSRISLNPNKAGLEKVDRDYVNKVIYETSKDSLYFKNELKKERQVQERVVWSHNARPALRSTGCVYEL